MEFTEIDINVDGEKYIRIRDANEWIDINAAYSIQENIPNSLVIADDRGNALIYSIGNQDLGYIIVFDDLGIDITIITKDILLLW